MIAPLSPSTRRRRMDPLGLCALALLPACASVLGIEDADCDPSFDPACDPPSSILPLGGSESGMGQGGNANGQAGNAATSSAAAGGAATSNAAASGADDGRGGSEAVARGPVCTRYCDAVLANCTGDFAVYASNRICENVCALLDPGQPGDEGTNTVECRLARAELAGITGEPSDYCFSAGPGGGDVCGADCEGYCDVMGSACADAMGSREECLAACRSVPVAPGAFSVDLGDYGDSIQCRLFHASAATADPVVHCEHAAGLAVCVGPPPAL